MDTSNEVKDQEININSSNQVNNPKKKSPSRLIVLFISLMIIISAIIATSAIYKYRNKESNSTIVSAEQVTVDITENGLFPQTIVVKKGTVVNWQNKTSRGIRIAAEPYPEGDTLPELDSVESFEPGEIYAFAFEEEGSYNYYIFDKPESQKAVVIVE